MIYAQRPDATACTDYDVWNNKMNRYVRRGSKGIALLDESGGYPRLHYVFDVSDTAPRRNALYPDLWQINESLKKPVMSMLAEKYGVKMQAIALAWHWAKGVASPIVGATRAQYLDDSDAALNVVLTPEDVAYLEEPYVPHHIVGAIDHNPPEGVMLLDEKK